MIEYQQDDDGTVSCQHRTAHPRDPTANNWCSAGKELCRYDANCRVPIPTLLSQVVAALEDLVESSENMVEIMVDLGHDRGCVGSYREDLDTAREDLDAARIILKHWENNDGQK